MLPFLRKVVETLASMINDDMKREYGEKLNFSGRETASK